jgi:mono/diheme cytochrome c family protein
VIRALGWLTRLVVSAAIVAELPAGRIPGLGATPDFHHGLLAAPVQAADPADIAEGMRLYQQKGNCQACHGWAADGRKADNQMPDGPNLRETKLDRNRLTVTIKCGRPGTSMPAFDKFAYSDGRCYGMKQEQLKSFATRMPDPPATLQQREIDLIADFLFSKVIGKGPMDHAKCIEYWGSDVDSCREFPK